MADRPILFTGPMVRALLEDRKTQTRGIIPSQPDAEMHVARVTRHPMNGSPTYHAHEWRHPFGSTHGDVRLRHREGDRLWVKEKAAVRYTAWHHKDGHSHQVTYAADQNEHGQYIANIPCGGGIRKGKAPSHFPRRSHRIDGRPQWAPSIHMPRWASRLTLIVTDVRIQRLNDISAADAIAEGIFITDFGTFQPPGDASIDGGDSFHPLKPRQHAGWNWRDAPGPEHCLAFPESAYGNFWNSINGPGSWAANPWVAAYTFDVQLGNIDHLPCADGSHGLSLAAQGNPSG